MSTPSSADTPPRAGSSPDESLIADDGIVATSHKGLVYPLGKLVPREGDLITIAPGVGWARVPIPGGLAHINVWLLDDSDDRGEGVAIVDTGMNIPECRAGWEALFEGALAGRRVTRVICTHFHPDHMGLAGWLCARFGVKLWMSRIEYLMARVASADARPTPPDDAVAHWRFAGWDAAQIGEAEARGWSGFRSIITPLPDSVVILADGQLIRIGAHDWRVVTGRGHTPDHSCLLSADAGVLIAGDQVLPRITSNVSLGFTDPEGDPLGDWLASIDQFLTLDADLLVLPAHGEPFTGLHLRLAALRDGHRARLDELTAHLAEAPRRAVDCFTILFRRQLNGVDLFLGSGEALAHLRRLEREGAARCRVEDGVGWWSAAA